MKAEGRQLQLARKSSAIERFDIDKFVDKAIPFGAEAILGEAVKHERVVGVRTVSNSNRLDGCGGHRKCFGTTVLDRSAKLLTPGRSKPTSRDYINAR